ncbi:MAG: hypothetical protein L0Y71_18775, partial [Gemmataceae bacterium]|nr:hypothetical protein [Gemmataceae bacterium]
MSQTCALAQSQSPADIARRVDQLLIKERPSAPLPELCDDATFLRRAALDLTGKLPDAAAIAAFS